jgi:hypothetical protein
MHVGEGMRAIQSWSRRRFPASGAQTMTPADTLPSAVKGLDGVTDDGTARCWGLEFKGDRGNGHFGGDFKFATPVVDLTGAISLTGGFQNYCAVLRNGGVKCWGTNDNDQPVGGPPGALGDGGNAPYSDVAVEVKNVPGAVSVASDGEGFCAFIADGGVRRWGENNGIFAGFLGDGGKERSSNVAVRVIGLGPGE